MSEQNNFLSDPKKAVSLIALGAGAFLGYKLIVKPSIDKAREREVEMQASGSLTVQQALQLRDMMNPSGQPWMRKVDGTNDAGILELGRSITNLPAVQDAYYRRTQRNLLEDLRSELSLDHYQSFLNTVALNTPTRTVTDGNGNKTEVPTGTPTQSIIRGRYRFAIKTLNFRATPVVPTSEHDTFNNPLDAIKGMAEWISRGKIGSNKIGQFKAGEFVGYTTGATFFDNKSNTKFIQATFTIDVNSQYCPTVLRKKEYAGKIVTGWVSASTTLLDQFNYWKEALDKGYRLSPWKKYKAPGLGAMDHMLPALRFPRLMTNGTATILDKTLQYRVGRVAEGTVIGRKLYDIVTAAGRYTKFQDGNGVPRYVKSNTIIEF